MSNSAVNNNMKFEWSKLNNKFGTLSYGLFVLSAFLPMATIKMFGVSESVYGTDIIGGGTILLMFIGALLCVSGAPKLLAKGIAALAIIYFYYSCYQAYAEFSQFFSSTSGLGDLFGGSSRRQAPDTSKVIADALSMLSVGFWLMTASFFMMKAFLLSSYTESPMWLPVKDKVAHLVTQGSKNAQEKVSEIKEKQNTPKK